MHRFGNIGDMRFPGPIHLCVRQSKMREKTAFKVGVYRFDQKTHSLVRHDTVFTAFGTMNIFVLLMKTYKLKTRIKIISKTRPTDPFSFVSPWCLM